MIILNHKFVRLLLVLPLVTFTLLPTTTQALSIFGNKSTKNTSPTPTPSNGKPMTRIRASKTTIQPIPTKLKTSLHQYMQLPAAQYTCVPMPLNSSLTRIKGTGNQFRLVVPPISLNLPGIPLVKVCPIVFAQVLVDSNEVSISSHSCIIEGSELIENLNINDLFEFQVKILLTWNNGNGNDDDDGVGATETVTEIEIETEIETDTSTETSTETSKATLNDDDIQGDKGPWIRAQSEIKIDVDPPGPFVIVPNKILEAVGNRAIQIVLGALQKNFMKSLGNDFEKWAVDEKYRLERQQLQLEFLQEDGIDNDDDETITMDNGMDNGVKVNDTLSAYLN